MFASLLAVSDVGFIADVRWMGSPAGAVFARSRRPHVGRAHLAGVARRDARGGIDGLTVGFVVAAVALSPFALDTRPAWRSPGRLALAAGIGVFATVVPYVLNQIVFAAGLAMHGSRCCSLYCRSAPR
ncbi:hypothetical protein [Actinocrispum sp. NPDC049592]|uniref:hypothetical protein n=1 Tax=Actinocrispum sp. NPDC049592 TaxID=3154835 RepID=UPI003419271D